VGGGFLLTLVDERARWIKKQAIREKQKRAKE
jgi:hypothetical protein